MPWKVVSYNGFTHNIDPNSFQFTATNLSNCDILQQAFTRYKTWTFPYKHVTFVAPFLKDFLGPAHWKLHVKHDSEKHKRYCNKWM